MDPLLLGKRRSLVVEAAKTLMECRMVKFDMNSGNFFTTVTACLPAPRLYTPVHACTVGVLS